MESKVTRKVNKEIVVKLSVAQLAQLGDENAELVQERDSITSELKEFTTPRKARLKEIEKRRDEIASAQLEKQEMRMEECEMELDYEAGSVRFLFEGEVVEERAMTESERQVSMFGTDKAEDEEEEGGEREVTADDIDSAEDIDEVIRLETKRGKAGQI